MKKILSLILVLVMLLTTVPLVSAEDDTKYKVGDTVRFGSYPQTKVQDNTIISKLNELAPNWDEWTSYGYYSGTGPYGTMVSGDWAKYIDVSYNNKMYRGVQFFQYRPYNTLFEADEKYSAQDENGYLINQTYWFVFEDIDWKILDPIAGLVVCESIIDSQPISNTAYLSTSPNGYWNDDLNLNLACDYETSSIRRWLNDNFYNLVFSEIEKKQIINTVIDNKGYYTLSGQTGYENLDGNPTKDHVFLLSYEDIKNSNYGFSANNLGYDISRRAPGSDYAKCQGLSVQENYLHGESGYWYLRTPGSFDEATCSIDCDGGFGYYFPTTHTDIGIRPALVINLNSSAVVKICKHNNTTYHKKIEPTCIQIGYTVGKYCNDCNTYISGHEEIPRLEHTYVKVITEPTCTEGGYTTYTCACSDTYTADEVNARGHSYISEITTPATHLTTGVMTFTCGCGDTYTETIDKITTHNHNAVVTEPTCTDKGYTTYTCECGDTYVDDYTDMLDHEYTSEITTEPTHLKEGVKTFTCKCGDTYTEAIAKLEGHTYTSEVTKEATHLEEGETTYTCACGDSYTEAINKLTEHTYKAVITEPTCTAKGYTTYTCECNDSYVSDYVGVKGHSYASTVTTPATHTKEGVLTYTCSKCGDSYTDKIDKTTEHTYNEKFVAPSCTETGYTVFTCACGDTYIGDYISETGHNDKNNDGTCDGCGIKLSTTDNENCSCNCHKSGLMGIIWKILRFFYKLFGTNKTCSCGIAHY